MHTGTAAGHAGGGFGSCLCGPFEGHGSSVFSGERDEVKGELPVVNADSETATNHGSFDQFFTLEYCGLCRSFSGHFTAPLWKHAGVSYIPEPQMQRYIPRPTVIPPVKSRIPLLVVYGPD